MLKLRRNQTRLEVQVRRLNIGGRNTRGGRASRQPRPIPRQQVAAQRRQERAEILTQQEPDRPRQQMPRPDIIENQGQGEDMPEGERRHRDDVQNHFQRLIDRVRLAPEI